MLKFKILTKKMYSIQSPYILSCKFNELKDHFLEFSYIDKYFSGISIIFGV